MNAHQRRIRIRAWNRLNDRFRARYERHVASGGMFLNVASDVSVADVERFVHDLREAVHGVDGMYRFEMIPYVYGTFTIRMRQRRRFGV